MTRTELDNFINGVLALRKYIDDKFASMAIGAYPTLHGDGSLIKSGTRINYNNQLMRAAVDCYDDENSTPDVAPALWEEIMYHEGIRIIPEYPTSGTAFAKDELGWWKGNVYKSLRDSNIHTPEGYPDGWEIVNNDEEIII